MKVSTTHIAQFLSAIFVLILGGAGITSLVSPTAILGSAGLQASSDYGITTLRTLGAPTLALAITTIIGAVRKEWLLILPASLYFFLNGSARVISLIAEQYDPIMIRGLVLTGTLFVLSQVAIYLFRRGEGKS